MTSLNKATVVTIILHGLIFLLYGHGVKVMAYFELNFSKDAFSSTVGGGDYERSLPLSSLLSLLGHMTLLSGLIMKATTSKFFVLWLGLTFMTASILNIFIHSFDFIAIMVIVGSFPYLLSSIWLLIITLRNDLA
ncbi:MAG: hypothetical protein JWQ09_390 [Segetibacter sp.]|nr:hypothetical protein [Segetibacter sp.]